MTADLPEHLRSSLGDPFTLDRELGWGESVAHGFIMPDNNVPVAGDAAPALSALVMRCLATTATLRAVGGVSEAALARGDWSSRSSPICPCCRQGPHRSDVRVDHGESPIRAIQSGIDL